MSDYAIDLTPFFESKHIKPLLQNSIVTHKLNQYRVDRIFRGENHAYVFICIGGPLKRPFAKTPSYVRDAINNKIITVDKLWNF